MPFPIRSITLVLILSLSSGADLRAQGKGRPAPEEQTGLKVGAKAPKFTLKDQEGREHSLDEFLGKGKVALVFYRSADW
jgi:cytochrome oxidase Cu insertion factor (SCO1/SenC/PrrC family)